jgi:hypothetical protein
VGPAVGPDVAAEVADAAGLLAGSGEADGVPVVVGTTRGIGPKDVPPSCVLNGLPKLETSSALEGTPEGDEPETDSGVISGGGITPGVSTYTPIPPGATAA